MARYAIVQNGVVANVVLASSPLSENWIASDVARIGDAYDGEAFSTPAKVIVRQGTVSRTQAFLALRLGGHITQAEARDAVARNALPAAITTAISGLPAHVQDAAEIRAWGAETIPYGDPLLDVFAAAFNLEAEDLNALWDVARGL